MNDELLARALLHSDRKPLVVVLCPRSNHKDQLGKVYEMPAGKAPGCVYQNSRFVLKTCTKVGRP